MFNVKTNLYYLWVFLLPFSWLFSALTNVVAPDKMLAPLLIILGGVTLLGAAKKRVARVLSYVFLAVLLLLIKNISFVGSGEIYWSLMIDDGIKIGYFIIPLLYIDSLDKFNRTSWLIVFIAFVGGLSAFLASVELVTLPVERFEASRVGYSELKKAIGLFTSYGDFSQYLAFAISWVVVAPTLNLAKENKRYYKVARFLVILSVVVGMAGMQSRNVLLSIVLCLCVLWFLSLVEAKSKYLRNLISVVVVFFILVSVILVSIFSSEIIGFLSGIGGGLASNTAHTRLAQYAFALKMIDSQPLLGADLVTYSPAIEGIHNMWLRLAAHGGLISVMIIAILLSRIFGGMRKSSLIRSKQKYATVVSTYFIVMLFSVMFYTAMGQLYWALLGIATSLYCIDTPLEKNAESQDLLCGEAVSQEGAATSRIIAKRKQNILNNNS